MNLRLPEELAARLRELSEETGRSQQDLAREALEEYVRDYRMRAYPKEVRHLITPAQCRPNDPQAMEGMRTTGTNVDAESLLATLLEDRRRNRF